MAVRAKVEVWDQTVQAFMTEDMSPAARRKALVDFSRANLAEGQRINASVIGHVPDHDTYVDGRLGDAEETVSPSGEILYEFQLETEMLDWIGQMLVEHSPVRSGRYSESFAVFVDDQVVQQGEPIPGGWDQIIFLNLQPYARKIERGLSPQAPEGVFDVVATMAQRRFGNVARIRYGFRAPTSGAIDTWASGTVMESPYRRGAKRDEWLRRQPAIVITR